jgi:hypothetical protein
MRQKARNTSGSGRQDTVSKAVTKPSVPYIFREGYQGTAHTLNSQPPNIGSTVQRPDRPASSSSSTQSGQASGEPSHTNSPHST